MLRIIRTQWLEAHCSHCFRVILTQQWEFRELLDFEFRPTAHIVSEWYEKSIYSPNACYSADFSPKRPHPAMIHRRIILQTRNWFPSREDWLTVESHWCWTAGKVLLHVVSIVIRSNLTLGTIATCATKYLLVGGIFSKTAPSCRYNFISHSKVACVLRNEFARMGLFAGSNFAWPKNVNVKPYNTYYTPY